MIKPPHPSGPFPGSMQLRLPLRTRRQNTHSFGKWSMNTSWRQIPLPGLRRWWRKTGGAGSQPPGKAASCAAAHTMNTAARCVYGQVTENVGIIGSMHRTQVQKTNPGQPWHWVWRGVTVFVLKHFNHGSCGLNVQWSISFHGNTPIRNKPFWHKWSQKKSKKKFVNKS